MTTRLSRRQLIQGLLAAVVVLESGAAPAARAAGLDQLVAPSAAVPLPPSVVATLEAFADTLVPGAKRHTGDRSVAGAAPGAGAVDAGALALLTMPEAGMELLLPELATLLDAEATAYAASHLIVLDPTVPPLVALPFGARTALLSQLLDPAHADQQVWILLTLMVFLAFHTAGFEHTPDAIASGHPGLARLRFPAAGADDLYRYPDFSYGLRLADSHPGTTASGSPA